MRWRERCRATAVLLGAVVAGAGAAAPAGEQPFFTSGPPRPSMEHEAPALVYSADPGDSWSVLHHLLFAAAVRAMVPAAKTPPPRTPATPLPADALVRDLEERLLAGARTVTRFEGGDLPDFFFTLGGWAHLVSEPRYGRLLQALAAEVAHPHLEGRTTEARVLFQQDLWNRFDLLSVDWEGGGPQARQRRDQLRRLLGGLMARLAVPRDELLRLRPNLPEAALAHPELADVFAPSSPWRELLRVSKDGYEITSHARTAGLRRVFQVYRRLPAGTADERADGTRVLLVERLLALARDGEIVALPLVVGVEEREFRPPDPGSDGRLDPEDLPFRILHVSRAALASPDRPGGGLTPVAADELVPQVVGCFPRQPGGRLVPAQASCVGCHGADGRHLMTTSFHGTLRVEERAPGSTAAEDAVIAEKRKRAGYTELRTLFGAR